MSAHRLLLALLIANVAAAYGTLLRGSQHPAAKLTEQQVATIRRRLVAGERPVDLAAEYGVHPTTIRVLKRRMTWRHVA